MSDNRIEMAGGFKERPRPISPAKMRSDIDGLKGLFETLKHCAMIAEKRLSNCDGAIDGLIKGVGKIIPMVDQLVTRCERLEMFILTQMTISAAQNIGREIPPEEMEAAQQMLFETLEHWKAAFSPVVEPEPVPEQIVPDEVVEAATGNETPEPELVVGPPDGEGSIQ